MLSGIYVLCPQEVGLGFKINSGGEEKKNPCFCVQTCKPKFHLTSTQSNFVNIFMHLHLYLHILCCLHPGNSVYKNLTEKHQSCWVSGAFIGSWKWPRLYKHINDECLFHVAASFILETWTFVILDMRRSYLL